MSQVFTPSSGGLTEVSTDATLSGDGTSGDPLSVAAPYLETVSTDATLSGDGTAGSPLSVVGGGGSTYSVAKTVFSNAALPPFTVPSTTFLDTALSFTDELVSPDADFITSDLRFVNAGTYRVYFQATVSKVPSPSHEDLQIIIGFTLGPSPPPYSWVYQSYEYAHFESNDEGTMTATLDTVLEATAGQTLQPTITFEGSAGAQATLDIAVQGTVLIVERVA